MDFSWQFLTWSIVAIIIAKEMPASVGKLRRMLKSKHSYIERNVDSVVSVIRQSMRNYAAFESAAQSLKDWSPGTVRYLYLFIFLSLSVYVTVSFRVRCIS